MWPDQNYTPDAKWDNPTFRTFNPGNTDNTKTQPHLEPPKLTETGSMSPQNNGNVKSNSTNNLLLQLDERHPKFQELIKINDHLVQDSNPGTHQKVDETPPQQLTQSKECRAYG